MGKDYTRIQRALSSLQVQRFVIFAERSSRQQIASSVDGELSNERTIEAEGTLPKVPRFSDDSEEHFLYRLMQIEVPLKPEGNII